MSEEVGAEGRPSGSSKEEGNGEVESLPGGRSERREAARKAGARRYTSVEREELLAALESSGESLTSFCESRGMSPTTVRAWQDGKLGEPSPSPKRRTSYTGEQRRAAVDAYLHSGRTRADFAKLWGMSAKTLERWLKRHAEGGGQGTGDAAARWSWTAAEDPRGGAC